MKNKVTYHSAITGKFVSKKYAEDNPDTTVKVTSCKFTDMKQELTSFALWLGNYYNDLDYPLDFLIDKYMNRK